MTKKLTAKFKKWAIRKLGGFTGPICVIELSSEDLEKIKEEAIQRFKDELTKEVHKDV